MESAGVFSIVFDDETIVEGIACFYGDILFFEVVFFDNGWHRLPIIERRSEKAIGFFRFFYTISHT